MGGKNAMIVLEDANLDLALDGAVWGAFGTTGQRCTATSRIIVQKSVAGEFTRRLVERAQALRVGDGLDEQVEMGPQINQQQVETSDRYTAIAQKEGAQLLTGGNRAWHARRRHRRAAAYWRRDSFLPPRSLAQLVRTCALPGRRYLVRS